MGPESLGRTGVDELLLRHLPALVCVDLGLELANLSAVLARWAGRRGRIAGLRTVSDGSASMTNLFCLRSCKSGVSALGLALAVCGAGAGAVP